MFKNFNSVNAEFYLIVLCILAYSSMAERPAVNRSVAGSSPAMPVLENEKENEL